MSSISTTTGGSGTLSPFTLAALLDRGATALEASGARLADVRAAALARAGELGLPSRADEEWRYTNPKPILDHAYVLPEPGPHAGTATIDGLPLEPVLRLVFVDGRFDPERSDLAEAPPGLTVQPIGVDEVEPDERILGPILDRAVADARDGFEALGAGLAGSGALVHLGPGTRIERPIVIVFRAERSDASILTTPSVTVVAETGARAEVIEDHQGAAESEGLTLGRTELRVARDAHVEHVTIERESASRFHVSTLRLIQAGSSFARSHRVLLGGSIVRNDVHATIEGEHAESAFNGVFVPEHRQHHDTRIRVEHMAPDCHSRQFYRGVLADRARGVFTGRIYVKDVAQKTDAIQSNSNLLLSPEARVTAKPQLEIYADDVRCTHGATSGMIDEDALFYLRARGVSRKTARLLLLHAFAGENIDRIANESLREFVRSVIFERLDAALERQP